jgi:NADPH:quinone reductase-like Zn-dependent oxidoreductase
MIEAGEIKATIDRIYPMEQATEAHRRVESEKRLGCVVISIQSV